MHIVGSSPELLVRVHDRTVEYRPIAGTRPRSADEVEDRALEADLRADEKEVAEHVMLVDLGRNDVGRVSEYGSVKVKDLMFVERYSHVMHLVSSLEGSLRADLQAVDAFRACFPAGTLSGAPKIRAMEIIEELEPARRGVYGGRATSRPAPVSSPTPSRKTSSPNAPTKPAPSSAPSNARATRSRDLQRSGRTVFKADSSYTLIPCALRHESVAAWWLSPARCCCCGRLSSTAIRCSIPIR
jgi:hypothetical protein